MKTDLQADKTSGDTSTVDRRRRGIVGAVCAGAVGIGFAAVGLCGALWTAITGRFLIPNVVTEPPNRFKIGPPSDYPPDVVDGRFHQSHGVWIVNGSYRGRREIFALRTVCTHLGCIVIWQEAERVFQCPCHGSGFYANGINFEGPAPRPLERYAIRLADDGQLEVDISVTFQEELGQWSNPASYVVA